MPVQKIKSGRVLSPPVGQFIGSHGTIFFDEDIGDLRLSDGHTPGGIPLTGGGLGYILPTASTSTLGGIKIGTGLSVDGAGVVSAIATSTYVLVTATNTILGGIKVGANLSIAADGTLNANTSTAGVSDSFRTFKVSGNSDLVATGADIVEFIAGAGIFINTDATATPYKTMTIAASMSTNLDGGIPSSVYGGILAIDGGGV